MQIGKALCLGVKQLRGGVINLVKGGRRKGEAHACQGVLQIGLAKEEAIVIRADDVGFFGIDIEIAAHDFGVLFSQKRFQFLCVGQALFP